MRHSLLLPALLAFPYLAAAQTATTADVVVYGSTPGGFCAAIAAAREGASVILLEPTAHVGGVNTGGLSFSDSNQTVRSTVMGLFDEWHSRVERDYADRGVALPYKVAEKDHKPWTYEPSVAMRVTKAMLAEAKVTVLTEHSIKSIEKDGRSIRSITTSQGAFRAKTFVDATYEGDLMAAAGIKWTIGREGRSAYGESLAGRQYPKAPMAISGLNADGKTLPLITTDEAGPDEEGDSRVMVYSFRLCLTKDPANRVPFPAPTKYDPARFEVVRRYFAQEKRPHILWDLYPLPNGKFDANNGIGKQFSMGLVGACNGWSEADAAKRAEIWEAHKQYTLELYQFLTTDAAVPENLRKDLSAFGLCADEFPATDHWSPQLYVREGRRMQGDYVLSQKDILGEATKEDAIAVSSFPIDSHDVQRVARKDGTVINEGTIFPVRISERRHGYRYHVPYRSITPKAAECENLLVPVALSATHVAYSSIRVEPTWMILGQSAGIAAALSAKEGVAVQQLPYSKLRERILAQKQVLEIPPLAPLPAKPAPSGNVDPAKLPGIVLDDAQAELKGDWNRSTNFKSFVGAGYVHDEQQGDGRSSAVFTFTAPKTGRYDLRVAYSPHATRAKNVPITLESGGKTQSLTFDQTQPIPAGENFRSAGIVEVTGGEPTRITISNRNTQGGFVIVDALQLVEETQK